MYELRKGLPALPVRIMSLAVDKRGYPVPWFVHWINGEPDFRVIGPGKIRKAIKLKCCWICGNVLGKFQTFVVGPMCVVNRTSAEPPSHLDCAQFAAQACPFLVLPKATRREANLPEYPPGPGMMIERNPGVCALWTTRTYTLFSDGINKGVLFEIGEPASVEWYAQGRAASREEVLASIDSGVPILKAEAEKESADSVLALQTMIEKAVSFVPAT